MRLMWRAVILGWLECLLLVGVLVSGCEGDCACDQRGAAKVTRGDATDACRAACATCAEGTDDAGVVATRACVAACARSRKDASRVGCEPELSEYLRCLSSARVDRDAMLEDPVECLLKAAGAEGCRGALAALRSCDAPCRDRGSLHLGQRTWSLDAGTPNSGSGIRPPRSESARIEVETLGCLGCADVADPKRGAPPGAPCEAASLCATVCCPCPDAGLAYMARVCSGGACLGSHGACALVESVAMDMTPCR